MPIFLFSIVGIGCAFVLTIGLILFLRAHLSTQLTVLRTRLDEVHNAQTHASECLERELRSAVTETARMTRVELTTGFVQFQQSLSAQLTSIATLQNNQIDAFAQQLAKLTAGNTTQLEAMRHSVQQQAQQAREEQGMALKRFSDTLHQQLSQLSEENSRRMAEMRATLEQKLKDIETNNALKLDEMRHVVDEKLHATLEQRLGESFKLVGEQLEQVHRGLGEMQTLAIGVGDLKKVLTNVKTRGTWGEVQLGALLEQILTAEQYARNVVTVPGSNEHVEFALRLPGRSDAMDADGLAAPVWLPIDAKFPRADYERLLEAQERADPVAVEDAWRALEACVRQAARTIAQKYLAPPHTTDFGLLFLPTEGLYAEVLRRPGLSDAVQRDYRITIAGPTTLTALLNSLQMGFRTLAIEKRSSEVWRLLGTVKTEFMKFGEVLAKTKAQLETVTRSIVAAETRTRVMHKQLRNVEALPSEPAPNLLTEEESI
ncbi:DNA recombination protein RmuC [Mycoavidus cysteinexigens]|uniref:DNA recombination protein RmuC n=1 Tax=Mycoavidus cysteinexigens TaxID=1553431 RepID=UPI0005EE2A4B|nr:DNA recombination protein RmuC [Mycoavidus cysteinexigens]